MNPVYIDIDNVYRYYCSIEDLSKPTAELAPVIMLPFEKCIVTFRVRHTQFHVELEMTEFDTELPALPVFQEGENKPVQEIPAGAKFVLNMTFYGHGILAFSTYHFADANGYLITSKAVAGIGSHFLKVIEGASEGVINSVMAHLSRPIMFAISLMHCKNVELVDKPVSRQIRRRNERKGVPTITYKTLVIEPFKKQVRNEARQTGESELKRALHICRGHFATYSEERPLFGKYTGTFWKPMHVRGSKAIGQVIKDYKVIGDEGETRP
jgi:hypothetical protein